MCGRSSADLSLCLLSAKGGLDIQQTSVSPELSPKGRYRHADRPALLQKPRKAQKNSRNACFLSFMLIFEKRQREREEPAGPDGSH